jgi:hypothetical protein
MAKSRGLGGASSSPTSTTPKKLITAATAIGSSPGHRRSKPADAGAIAAINARWAPAELPTSTMRDRSSRYCAACRITQRSAQRASSTAAGARATARDAVIDVHHRKPMARV